MLGSSLRYSRGGTLSPSDMCSRTVRGTFITCAAAWGISEYPPAGRGSQQHGPPGGVLPVAGSSSNSLCELYEG